MARLRACAADRQLRRQAGKAPYDFFHVNSIQLLPNGNLLVSARHTWTVYEINKKAGAIVWGLGGKRSSFGFGPGANFEWQHDAHLQPDGTLTLFDNGAGPGRQHERQSRALGCGWTSSSPGDANRGLHQ